jgi:hypothetical protein
MKKKLKIAHFFHLSIQKFCTIFLNKRAALAASAAFAALAA